MINQEYAVQFLWEIHCDAGYLDEMKAFLESCNQSDFPLECGMYMKIMSAIRTKES